MPAMALKPYTTSLKWELGIGNIKKTQYHCYKLASDKTGLGHKTHEKLSMNSRM